MRGKKQLNFWSGKFGEEYTLRNTTELQDWDEFHLKTWGIIRSDMYESTIGDLPRDIKILEVGCNTGMQLSCLQKMGFKNLFGIELQKYAVEIANKRTQNINIIQASGFDIPFNENDFDLVFTSGVLIHIDPENLQNIMSELVRCSKKYILGFEYYSPKLMQVEYRGNQGVLWKADYCEYYKEYFPDLKELKKEFFTYLENDNIDSMYLLSKD